MHHFHYKGNELHAEDVAIKEIVAKVGSPVYIYSRATLERHFKAMDEAFAELPHTICFSVKANSNLAVLKTFINLGGGVDIVSGGELFRALRAGVEPQKVVVLVGHGVVVRDDPLDEGERRPSDQEDRGDDDAQGEGQAVADPARK